MSEERKKQNTFFSSEKPEITVKNLQARWSYVKKFCVLVIGILTSI
jgi:hypothetical protein